MSPERLAEIRYACIEQAFLDAAVGLYIPALELLAELDDGMEASPEARDALEKAIGRFETWRQTVIDEAWASLPPPAPHVYVPNGDPVPSCDVCGFDADWAGHQTRPLNEIQHDPHAIVPAQGPPGLEPKP